MGKKFISLNGKYYKEVDLNEMSSSELRDLIDNVRKVDERIESYLEYSNWPTVGKINKKKLEKDCCGFRYTMWRLTKAGDQWESIMCPSLTGLSRDHCGLSCCKSKWFKKNTCIICENGKCTEIDCD